MMTKSAKQQAAEDQLLKAINMVETIMPDRMGIAILVFERGRQGNIGYIANANRQDMRRCLMEFLGKWEGDAAGAPFHPLTLDAFESYAATNMRQDVLTLIKKYRDFSNAGPRLPEELPTKKGN